VEAEVEILHPVVIFLDQPVLVVQVVVVQEKFLDQEQLQQEQQIQEVVEEVMVDHQEVAQVAQVALELL
tara:strand:+ start:359 stop:565 length:207 start_codon:yes stop_codon:yes gene_type:complete